MLRYCPKPRRGDICIERAISKKAKPRRGGIYIVQSLIYYIGGTVRKRATYSRDPGDRNAEALLIVCIK